MTTSPALAVPRYPHLETTGCSLAIGNRRILCLAFSCMTIIFYSDMEPFQNILHLSPATRILDENPDAYPSIHFFVIYFQGEKKDRIGHFYSTGLQVKQLVLIFTILLNSEHPCCHMYRVNVHEAQSLYCLECSQGYVLTIPGIPW